MKETKKTLTEKRFFEWYEDDVSVTLRNRSGSYGGGSEVLVIDDISEKDRNFDGKQPSGKLLRTGCIQRHADNGEK